MKREELTAYDKFMVSKNNIASEEKMYSLKNFQSKKYSDDAFSPDYTRYIENQLRRTQPSEEKVLTEAEFNQKNIINSPQNYYAYNSAVNSEIPTFSKVTETGRTSKKGLSNVKFKKTGKILLIAYVIIMICLALIVIVKTTTGNEIKIADASDAEIEKSKQIETMKDEQKEKNNSWFDGFCDSLK